MEFFVSQATKRVVEFLALQLLTKTRNGWVWVMQMQKPSEPRPRLQILVRMLTRSLRNDLRPATLKF